jgi:hypothetical protein
MMMMRRMRMRWRRKGRQWENDKKEVEEDDEAE